MNQTIVTSGVNSIDADSCFLRLSDNKEYFVHFDSVREKEVEYRIRKGAKNACIFHKENALNFIKESGAGNLEIVKVVDVLGNDGTLN